MKQILRLVIIVLFITLVYFIFVQCTLESFENIANKIDVIYYINLDHRVDRKKEIIKEIGKLNYPEEKIVRIPAVYKKEKGHLGCSMSHIKALKKFIESGHNNCIIFEDDFEFSQGETDIEKAFNNFFNLGIDYDVVMLSANEHDVGNTNYDFLKKVKMALTTAGYMVNKKFAKTLLKNFEEGCILLEESYNNKENSYNGIYAVDQYWISLQEKNNWFMFYPKLGKQRASYSDIMSGNVNYNV